MAKPFAVFFYGRKPLVPLSTRLLGSDITDANSSYTELHHCCFFLKKKKQSLLLLIMTTKSCPYPLSLAAHDLSREAGWFSHCGSANSAKL